MVATGYPKYHQISPLQPGVYNITNHAESFKTRKFFFCLGVGVSLHALNKFRNGMTYVFSD
jgi:hypothetical protein